MESLIPKDKHDFGNKSYWENFFANTSSAFEWYGDFESLKPLFVSNLKPSDQVLEVGCGNSQLSCQIYDTIGCQKLIGIDTSEMAILGNRKQCKSKSRPNLSFEQIDVFNLEDELKGLGIVTPGFNCIVDKGTLDAIHSGNSSDGNIRKYFDQISTALQPFGRYILITLAQDHIVHSIADYFLSIGSSWIVTCNQMTQPKPTQVGKEMISLPVFGFVMMKMRTNKSLPLLRLKEFQAMQPSKPISEEMENQLLDWIKTLQTNCQLRYKTVQNENYDFYLADEKTKTPVFFCRIISRKSFKRSLEFVEAVFLVPHCQNREPMYATEEGHQSLLKSMKEHQAVLLVYVNSSLWFDSLEAAKKCLSMGLQGSPVASPINPRPIYSTADGYPTVGHTAQGPFKLLRPSASSLIVASSVATEGASLAHTTSLALSGVSLDWMFQSDLVPHLLSWLVIITRYTFNSLKVSPASTKGIYLGVPPSLPLHPSISYSSQLPPGCPSLLTDGEVAHLRTAVAKLHPPTRWRDNLGVISKELAFIIYDPLIRKDSDFDLCYSEAPLCKFLAFATKSLIPGGLGFIIVRPSMENFTSETQATADLLEMLVPKTSSLDLMLTYNYSAGGLEAGCTGKGKVIVFMKPKSKSNPVATFYQLVDASMAVRGKSDKEIAAFLSEGNGDMPLPSTVFNALAEKCNAQSKILELLLSQHSSI